jgi:hypothetical protein
MYREATSQPLGINWFDPDARASDPGGWAVLLAAYASCVDGGKRLHADRRRRLHSVLYAGMVRRRFSSQDGMERLFSEARRAMISKQTESDLRCAL